MPCEFVSLMVAFASLFSKPVFQHAQVLLMGAILAPRKRTVTSALRVMGLSGRAFSELPSCAQPRSVVQSRCRPDLAFVAGQRLCSDGSRCDGA
jgi:hypothetical protein